MRGLFICILGCFVHSVFSIGPAKLDPDLAKALSSESIVGTTQIQIPDYPTAFNPSLVAYGDGYLLSFRITTFYPGKGDKPRYDSSFTGLAKLDKNLKLVKKSVHFLDLFTNSTQRSISAEDLKLMSVGDRIYAIFNDVPLDLKPHTNAMYFVEIEEVNGAFVSVGRAVMLQYEKARLVEKNWSPFVYEGKLCLIYSDGPRIILEADMETGLCKEIVCEPINYNWSWGRVRGGTPTYFVDGQFLSVFHSVISAESLTGQHKRLNRNYVMGAYTFDAKAPFSVRSMTSPLGQLSDYNHQNICKVVFPGGLVFEEKFVRVAWGKNDKQIIITTFDRDKFMASLKPVELGTGELRPVGKQDQFCPKFVSPQ
jgi:predicted GH43/DUF377 family glycosyl hydrolase